MRDEAADKCRENSAAASVSDGQQLGGALPAQELPPHEERGLMRLAPVEAARGQTTERV